MLQSGFVAASVQWEAASTVVVPQINADGLHVWPFDQAFPMDVRHFLLDSPCRMRMNRHSFFELAYVEAGEVKLQVQDRVFSGRAGDLMVIGSSLYHCMTSVGDEPLRLRVLFFEHNIIHGAGEGGEGEEYLAPFLLRSSDFPHILPASCETTEEISHLLYRIYGQLPAQSSRGRLAARTFLRMVLLLLVEHYADYSTTHHKFEQRELDLKRLEPVFRMVEEGYSQPLRVHDAARLCAMSDSHFMSFFKNVTGQPFLRYLNHFRIAKAQALLASTDCCIVEIAQQLGFCDQSHFGVVFRKAVGVTPFEHRRRNRAASHRGRA